MKYFEYHHGSMNQIIAQINEIIKCPMKKKTWNYGARLSPGTGAKVHLLCPQGCVLLGGLHTPTCLQVWCPVATSFPTLSASLLPSLVHLVHSFIHSLFTHSIHEHLLKARHWAVSRNKAPSFPFLMPRAWAQLLSSLFLWQNLSLLVRESDVRVIPSDTLSPRLKLPVSSYLHQSISTCLSILMAYGSRGEISKWEKISNCAYWAKENDWKGSFL